MCCQLRPAGAGYGWGKVSNDGKLNKENRNGYKESDG